MQQIKNEGLKKIQSLTPQNNEDSVPKKRGPKTGSKNKVKNGQELNSNINLSENSAGLKLTFASIFIFIGKTLSISFEFNKFELESEESNLLSEQADQVAAEFIPMVENKWTKLGIFLVSFMTVFGKKYFEFEKNRQKEKKENKKQNKEEAVNPENGEQNKLVVIESRV